MTGFSCLWSPTSTTWLARDDTMATSVSASLLIPHSSTINCHTQTHRFFNCFGGHPYNHHHHHYHRHHERAPNWNVAVSTSCSRSTASFHAEFKPWLSGWRSASMIRIQVWRGRPGRTFTPWGAPGSTYVGLWKYRAYFSSLLDARRSEDVLSKISEWATAVVVNVL